MTAASIEVRGLSHRYPGADSAALSEVAFGVEAGQRLGLLGPNGAGKSTLMRLLCGYLPLARTGQLHVDGLDVATDSLQVRTRVGYMPEHVPLYPELRVHEHLSFRAAIKRVPRRERRREVERVASKTGLSDRLKQPISQLSRGYRQRVGIADALLGAPPLIVLDEPTVGLDPNQVLDIRAMLRELGGAHTLVFSSHILAEVEALCDRVVILSEGRVVVDESLEDALATGHVQVRVVAGAAVTQALLAQTVDAEVEVVQDEGICSARLPLAADDDPEAVLAAVGQACAQAGVELRTLSMGRTRLEERFAAVTGARRD
ncbi:MAG: ABC transporter ATP-binding protein [Nannocystaceae bacterium]|nr:ABC transporter ATP-binding protein [Nannocystaceae bacterium]